MVGGLLSIMARVLTVLIALVAQGMALMSPVCFVRCIGADGHECVELMGQGCHCCDCQSRERSPDVCAVATCGHHHDEEEQNQHEHDAPVGWQSRCEHCSCQHSPLEAGSQVQAKSLTASGVSDMLNVATLPAMLDFVSAVPALENVSLRRSLLRLHESPQLAALATVVLRV